jgi:alpha-glucosidase
MHKAGSLAVFVGTLVVLAAPAQGTSLVSPDGRLRLEFHLTARGEPRYSVSLADVPVLDESKLGLLRDDADFTAGLELVSVSDAEPVRDDYELLTSKRRLNHYTANRRLIDLKTAQGDRLRIEFRVSDDGFALRYAFPEMSDSTRKIVAEATSFRLPAGARAWLQPKAVAKSGWSSTNPSYEELYLRDVPVGTQPPTGVGWVYPALFRSGDNWLLISETGLTRNYCATYLDSKWHSPEYAVAFPDPLENFQGGAVAPEHALPWTMPWRFAAVGGLATIVESTLGTDLATPPSPTATVSAEWPGKASWSWPLLKDGETVFDTQKRFIDYAADMGWRYTLIDALWDTQIGIDRIRQLVDYARGKGVKILLWYNSAGDWNETYQTPRDRMLTHESRMREFKRLADIGVAGLKVDFFGGDGQSVIGYYQDILEDAARFGLVMNFHGATLPRGWQRTYPNLMTMEAVRGLEFVTFEQRNADDEPAHAAMLPFTRNVFDPMDFTPVVLDRIPGIERRTTSAFELALSVLFTSGIQHYAEIPAGLARAPDYVRDFLRDVPSIWDDVRFIDGFPGVYVVLARRSGARWFVAGINAGSRPRDVTLDLASFGADGATLITDGDGGNLSFRREELDAGAVPERIAIAPNGGFVATVN